MPKNFGEMEYVLDSTINVLSSLSPKNKRQAGSHLGFVLQSLFIKKKRKKESLCPLK
jgi:hypothetical protein